MNYSTISGVIELRIKQILVFCVTWGSRPKALRVSLAMATEIGIESNEGLARDGYS